MATRSNDRRFMVVALLALAHCVADAVRHPHERAVKSDELAWGLSGDACLEASTRNTKVNPESIWFILRWQGLPHTLLPRPVSRAEHWLVSCSCWCCWRWPYRRSGWACVR